MEYQIIWFVLWGVLWTVYFMLDGFVMGAGILHPFLGKSEADRRVMINSIGPVWDGNEVWLITAGGATFAAFPTTYALMFSYLYTALLLLLFGLIIRGVSYEFRGKVDNATWRLVWDNAIFIGNLVPALLFGVAFGNIFSGLPIDARGYHGSLIGLLNPFGLITGFLFVMLFVVHGALYVASKSIGELSNRALRKAIALWPILLVTAIVFLAYCKTASKLYDNYLANPYLFIVPGVAVLSLFAIRYFAAKEAVLMAFSGSCLTIVLVVATGFIGLFPNLIPSSIDTVYSLTLSNSSSSVYTLKIMTVVAFIFVPIVIAYKIWVYRIFRAPVTAEGVFADKQSY